MSLYPLYFTFLHIVTHCVSVHCQYDKTKLSELVRASFREVISNENWDFWEANSR